jgi:CubicO group peptidase (beta-lactamase class C family)
MRTDGAINRRRLLQELGKAAAVAAVAPSLLGLSGHGSPIIELHPAAPEDVGMSAELLDDVFARLGRRVADRLFPGATALVVRKGAVVGHRAFGTKVRGADEPVTLDTIFDVQSMTKVLSTAMTAMVLADRGVIHLDHPVAKYLPDFAANGKAAVTIRDLLRYSAGLPLDSQHLDNADDAAVWKLMAETALEYAPGSAVLYSDLTYRLLGRVLEVAAGTDLNSFAKQAVWGPLGMHDTSYNPPAALRPRIAATGFSERRGYLVRGEVQDEQDFALGGITGCDGVFTTAMDVAIF